MSLDELAAVFSRVAAVLCGNTGVMHLACAVNAPVAALHGPTDPRKWGPRSTISRVITAGLPCSPCLYLGFEYACRRNTCLESIEVKDVYAALTGILAITSNN
jgi:heptosyltransferase I